MLVTKNHQEIRFRCLVLDFFFQMFLNDINHGYRAAILKENHLWMLSLYMAVTASCHHEKVRRTMCNAIVSYILKLSVT